MGIIVEDVATKTRPFLWRLFKPFREQLSTQGYIDIPEGTLTDFATVPKLLWGVFNPLGLEKSAYLVHDYLYQSKDVRGRKFADEQLRYIMGVYGASWLKRNTAYWIVRIFSSKYDWSVDKRL